MWLRNKETGRVCDAIVRERKKSDGSYSIIVCTVTKHGIGTVLAEYRSISKLYEEWEDYKPAEPLIKDEKIKKLLGEVVELELTVNELSKRFDEFNKHYIELCGDE